MIQKVSRQESMDQHILQQAAGFLSYTQVKILSLAQARKLAGRKKGCAKAQAMFRDQNRDSKPSISGTKGDS
jgi:hypothetical protein